MDRVSQNKEFLYKLTLNKKSVQAKLLKEATDEEIKTIIEILSNIDQLRLTDKEKKPIEFHKKSFTKFLKQKTDVKKLKRFIIKH